MALDRISLASGSLRLLPDIVRASANGRMTAADLFERTVRRRPDDVFVRFEGREVTYGELSARANRIAHWALASGLGKGDVVGLLMENRPEYLAVWLGLAKAGVTTALLNTQLRGEALAHCLASAGCRLLVLGVECTEAWDSLAQGERSAFEVHAMADPLLEVRALPHEAKPLDEEIHGYSAEDPPRHVRETVRSADPLFYIYTSGTTGLPKAARFSHARFLGGGAFALMAGFGSRDTLYCALPLYHTAGGVVCVHAVLKSGGTLALARRFRASRFWDDVVASRATAFQYIGELCRYLLNQPRRPAERSHALRFGVGNGLSPEVWAEFTERFGVPKMVEFYGATESNVSLVNLEGRVGSVGKPVPGTTAALVRYDVEADAPARDAAGHCIPCATGEPGELLGRIGRGRTPAGRFEGYTSQSATEKKILRDVFAPGDAWFRTGDLLERDDDGYYRFVDRVGDTFRWKGENVSTQQVAEALGAHPALELCTVYGVELPGAEGRAGMAALIPQPGAEIDGAELFAHVERSLPAYARPAFLRIQQSVEMTGTFKPKKVALQSEGFDPATVHDPILFRDDAGARYRALDPDAHQRIARGEVRF